VVGRSVGALVAIDGASVGRSVGTLVGTSVGALVAIDGISEGVLVAIDGELVGVLVATHDSIVVPSSLVDLTKHWFAFLSHVQFFLSFLQPFLHE
jgi:hypothetical protein